jgi:hypothetical protein
MATVERTCIGPDCDRRGGDLGMCSSHYQQRRLGKELTRLRVYTKNWDEPICSVPGCGRRHTARGLCSVHVRHMKKYGEVREIKPYRLTGRTCEIAGCDQPALAKLRCNKHLSYGYNLSRFHLSLEDFVRMLESQAGVCAICGGTNTNGKALSVDHDHQCCDGDRSCGACIRGLICQPCNAALGFMHDDPARLRAAANYVEAARIEASSMSATTA